MKIPYHVFQSKKPILEEIREKSLFGKVKTIDEFSGNSPPSVFVGSKLVYPKVNVGILSPIEISEDAWLYDAQNYWSENNFSIQDIIALRSNLINSRFRSDVYDARKSTKFLEMAQEISMANKSINVDIKLKKKIKLDLDFDKYVLPMGPRAPLEKIKITENIKIARQIDNVVSDTDLKANEAINYLFKKNTDEHTISKLLSLGLFGLKKNRKLVPTRWGITATDDSIGKRIIKKIKDYDTIDDYQLFFGHFLGNYYFIMLFPEVFSYELFELYLPRSSWNPGSTITVATDYESYDGRKSYAGNTVGGYYAARLAVLEYLNKIKRQASMLIIRLETDQYWASLGVWVVRSSARKAINNVPTKFEDKEKMLGFVRSKIVKDFNYNPDLLLKSSKLLNYINYQKRLKEFF